MAEDRVINLEIKDNVKTLKQQYKEAVKELQQMAATYGEMSEQAVSAAKRAAELKDQIEDTNDLMQSFKGEGAFIAMNKAMTAVASGFSAIEGGVALVGVESEALQETMVKLQASMALAQGLEGLEDAGRAFGALKTKAVDLGKTVVTSFQGMTTASKAFLVSGIGLVIAGVALAVNEFNKYNEQLKESQKQQKLLADIEKEAIKNISAEASAADKLQKQLKDENLSRAEKTAKVKEFQKEYPNLLSNIDAEKSSINEINTALTQNIELLKLQSKAKAIQSKRSEIYAQQLEIELGKEKAANEAKKEGGLLDDLFGTAFSGASTATITETETRLAKQLKIVDDFDASIQKQIEAIQKQGAVIKEEGDKENKNVKERINYARQLEKERIDAMEDGMEKRIKLLEYERAGELKDIDKTGIKAGELRKAIEERYLKEIQKVKDEYRDRSDRDDEIVLEKKLANRIEVGEQEIDAEKYVQSEIGRIRQEENDKEIQRKKDLVEAWTRITLQGLDLIASIAEANAGEDEKRQRAAFNIRKASNIAQATVDGYKAVLSTYADTPGGVVVKTIAATIAGGFAALKIGQIAKSKYESSSSGGGGGDLASGGTESFAPQFNVIGNSGINQLAQLQQQPVQAYVVSGEVTSAQALDRNRQKNATL